MTRFPKIKARKPAPRPVVTTPVIGAMTAADLADLADLAGFARMCAAQIETTVRRVVQHAMEASDDGTPFVVDVYYWQSDDRQAKVAAVWKAGRRGTTFTRGDYAHVEHHSFGVQPPREVTPRHLADGASSETTSPVVDTSTADAPVTTS